MKEISRHIQCLIIGSGPAGYTAAIYAARAGLQPVLYTGLLEGGLLTTTTEVDNYPGYPKGVNGIQMMEDLKQQALRFGTDIRYGMVTSVDFQVNPKIIEIDESITLSADTVIIATGASAKWLGLESEERLNGKGVSACAVCDGFFFKEKDVAVVGGGDTAAEEGSYMAKLCNKVYMIVRRDRFRASIAMQKKLFNTKNIEIIYNSVVREITGEDKVNGAWIENNKTGAERKLKIEGLFVAIGHQPKSEVFKNYLLLDDQGYIITKPGTTVTNIPGVFACGDVQDARYRQAVTAAGSGCMAALDAERWLNEIPEVVANENGVFGCSI